MRRIGIAGLVLAVGSIAAAAQGMKTPRIEATRVDWDAVTVELGTVDALKPVAAGELIASLNRATAERFPLIAASAVPVLLLFDTAAFLHDRQASQSADGNYLAGFNGVPFFYPGPAGYDAVVVARAQEMRELGIGFADPIYIHIGGSAVVYDLDAPTGLIGWPVHGLDEIPGIRRSYLENYVRYTFVRYGVPYVVSIECFDGGSRYRKISCRDADKVAVRFLKALRVAGGAPQPQPPTVAADTIDRPAEQSTVFTYHSPGDILPGTGFKRKGGVADYTVYSRIRFPMAEAPAFANSQSFMNWGNCEGTGRAGLGRIGGVGAYHCRVNAQPLIADESAADNYSYPWRDNFCETRGFYVGQCPGGLGHQGQDIRPASCKQRVEGANRCEPYLHDVVAVRDGAVLRAPGQEALYIVVNSPNERLRFRYLHMQPRQVDTAGMVSGMFVREGEVIGKVGNFFKRERGTTYHLHFDVQVPTKHGWVFVNPYMTLVAAYERLIRARGRELREDVPVATYPTQPDTLSAGETTHAIATPAVVAAKPTETRLDSPAEPIESGIGQNVGAEPAPVAAGVPAAAGGNNPKRPGARARGQVRSVGRGFSRPSARAWHFRLDVFAGHGQRQARHDGL